MISVPHTGAIRWATFALPQVFSQLHPNPDFPQTWADSPAVASAFTPVWKQHSGDPDYRVVAVTYRLGAKSCVGSQIIWEVHAMFATKQRYDRKDLRATFTSEDGRLLDSQVNS